MADNPWGRGAFAAVLAAGLLLIGLPLAELLRVALEGGGATAAAVFADPAGLRATANTVWTGALVTVFAVAAATAAALVTERTRAPAVGALRLAVLVPLVVPGFAAALSWVRAYGPSGLVEDLTGLGLPPLLGAAGVVVVLTVEALPLAYVVVVAALASRNESDAERAARASGATAAVTIRSVTLPLLRPALTGAAALVFVATVNSFGVPAVLGSPAGFTTITTRIYQDLARSADPAAFTRAVTLSAGLVAMTAIVVAAVDLTGSRRDAIRGAAPATGSVAGVRWPGMVLWGALLVTVAMPLAALALAALTRAAGVAPVPANWTVANFAEALQPAAVAALFRSLTLAGLAASVVLLLSGLLLVLRHTGFGRALGTGTTLTFAVPGSALAVAMLLTYGPWLRDTLGLILLAYVAKFWSLGHRSVAGAAGGIPPDLIRAARASGADPPTTMKTVMVPLLRPALAAGWLLVFLLGIHELTMSSLLYGPGSQTLAVVILNVMQLGDVTVTSALALLLTLLVLALSALLIPLRRARWTKP